MGILEFQELTSKKNKVSNLGYLKAEINHKSTEINSPASTN